MMLYVSENCCLALIAYVFRCAVPIFVQQTLSKGYDVVLGVYGIVQFDVHGSGLSLSGAQKVRKRA